MTRTVGLEEHKHETGTCFTTFVLPSREAPAPCGDPRCEAVVRHAWKAARLNWPDDVRDHAETEPGREAAEGVSDKLGG